MPTATILPVSAGIPRAVNVADEARYLLTQGCSTAPSKVIPVYLRKTQAEVAFEMKKGETTVS